jgi:hypothetical protein
MMVCPSQQGMVLPSRIKVLIIASLSPCPTLPRLVRERANVKNNI